MRVWMRRPCARARGEGDRAVRMAACLRHRGSIGDVVVIFALCDCAITASRVRMSRLLTYGSIMCVLCAHTVILPTAT